jgi:spermidine synthase
VVNREARAVAPLIFGSGLCALIYQVAWFRQFRLVFGASTAANAAVLSVFIAGLGLGGLFFGARADRHPRPLALYAHLEMGIAFSSAATPILLWLVSRAYIAVGGTASLGMVGGTLARLLLTALVLSGPTFLMGGTLPALARAVETPTDQQRRSLGLLYGVNTLGAVIGCCLANFLLLEVFGTRLTLLLACLVNLLVSVVARALSRVLAVPQQSHFSSKSEISEQAQAVEPEVEEPAAVPSWLVCVSAGVVGFAFFLMELVWYRMLAPLLGGTVFAFGLILAVALFGIGLGGLFYALLGRSRSATIGGFALTCLLEAVAVALPYALGDRIAVLALYLRPLGAVGFSGLVLGWTFVTVLVVLPAAFVAGVQFPMLIALLGSGRRQVGRQTGLAYACNTAGAISGALGGGFGLIPRFSAPGCWRAVGCLLCLLGVAAAAIAARKKLDVPRLVGQVLLLAAAATLLGATGPTAVWRHSSIGVGRVAAASLSSRTALRAWMNAERAAIHWQTDGIESSVALSTATGLAFVLNGKIDGHVRVDAATQVMSGLVGAALHPAPKRALVIGLGTGSTAGWLGAVPSIERVDVVELEPQILHVAQECRAVNQNALQNPKVHLAIGDARETLLTSRMSYDIIFSEPSNPYRIGIASLFTREYYLAVRDRLAEGGMFLQWVQAYNIDADTVRNIYATLDSVYPSVETWELASNDLLLIASARPLRHDVSALSNRLSTEPYRSALEKTWRTTGVEGFLAHFVARPSFARSLAAIPGELINTDDLNPVEFGFARAAGQTAGFSSEDVRAAARIRAEQRPDLIGGAVDFSRIDDEWYAFSTSEDDAPRPRPGMSAAQGARAIAEAAFLLGNYAEVVRSWRAQPREPIGATELVLLGKSLAVAGDEAALEYIERLRPLEAVEADMLLGTLRARQRRPIEAAAALRAAFEHYRSDPWPWLRIAQGALDEATSVAAQSPEAAIELYEALRQPFAASMLDSARTAALTAIAVRLNQESLCLPTLAQLEPYVPWRLDVLAWRARCYDTLGDPRAAQARSELSEYFADQPARLAGDPPQ